MGTASVINPDPLRGARFLRCDCLEEIGLDDIDRGWHPCGRTIEVRVGPGDFGAGQ